MERQTWSDEELLAAMQEALASAGTTPDDVRLAEQLKASGKAAWTWRTIDAELATLVFDSLLEESALVRGDDSTAARLLVFEGAGESSVEFEVGDRGLVGQLLPPAQGVVQMVNADGTEVNTDSDEVGCFELPLPPGPFRLLCRTAESEFTTEWVRL
ncbi:MAG TPA: hypothetical protein VEQ66_09510 [Propionibacteriaceae bacterium]|nr:hypothetical protein [Propionibacteriaceae bacterium]